MTVRPMCRQKTSPEHTLGDRDNANFVAKTLNRADSAFRTDHAFSLALTCLQVTEIRMSVARFCMEEDKVALLWMHPKAYDHAASMEILALWTALTEHIAMQKHHLHELEYIIWANSCWNSFSYLSAAAQRSLCGCPYACCPVCQQGHLQQYDDVLAAIEQEDDCWGL